MKLLQLTTRGAINTLLDSKLLPISALRFSLIVLFFILNWFFISASSASSSTVDDINPNANEKLFKHPGVLLDANQLMLLKKRVNLEPWRTAFEQMSKSLHGSRDYVPTPWQHVRCGYRSTPDFGCTDEKRDSAAAYTQALMWVITGDKTYANNSAVIMNAWANKLTGGHTDNNAVLQAAWASELWPRAGEILRYTYPEWTAPEQQAFAEMLRYQYLPTIKNGAACRAGNWEASTIDALMNIAVFLDDRQLFDQAINRWRERVKAYFYMEADGPTPIQPVHCPAEKKPLIKYWYEQDRYVNGLSQETCRDFGHMTYGLAALVNAAETARIQGVDLYGEEAGRLTSALEFHANYLNGADVPSWLCSGKLKRNKLPSWEIAYNHYHGRMGYKLPQTAALLKTIRPTGIDHHMAWEKLTHSFYLQ